MIPCLPLIICDKYSFALAIVPSSLALTIFCIRVLYVASTIEISFSTSIEEYLNIIGKSPCKFVSFFMIIQSLSMTKSLLRFKAGFATVQIVGR